MRITAKGQVTIPQAIREKAGLLPGAEVEFLLEGRTVRIARSRNPRGGLGARALSPGCAAEAMSG